MSTLPYGTPLLYGSTIPTTPTTPTTPTKSSFDYLGLGTTLLNFGLNIFGASENRKNAETQANALREKGYSEVEVAKLLLEAKKLELEGIKIGAGGGAKTGSNTLLIGLGVGGAVVIAIIIFAVTRKKT